MKNRCMFEKMAAGMALAVTVMAGAAMLPGSGHELIVRTYAADASNQNSQNISGGGTSTEDKIDETGSKTGCAENNGNSDDGSGIYDFKDNKTAGAVAITKKWDGGLTNAEREIPDMYLSTGRPSKSTKGYTVTFHGNGLKFADGTDENMVVYNSSGQIVEGSYKEAVGTGVAWYANEACTQKIEISDAGIPQVELTGDVDLWAKEMTFEIKGYNDNYQRRTENPRPTKGRLRVKGPGFNFARMSKSPFEVWLRTRSASYKQQYNDFNSLIPNTVTEIVFTDEVKPKDKATIDVDADGDGGVVAWLDDDARTVMKVSTQIPGVKVQAAKDSENMFFNRSKLQKIDFKMLDTQNVTDMCSMFNGCSGLTSLDLTPLDTQNVTDMSGMFYKCSGLTSLDLTPLDTQNVTDMSGMFYKCSGLTSLDLTPLDTQNVTNMRDLFGLCSGLTSLDLSPLDTQKVTDMSYMFYHCLGLISLDLTPLDTQNVTDMGSMFSRCSGLTSLDLSPLDTKKVWDMKSMFADCSGLTSLDLSPLDTQNVTDMSYMFYGCSGLTSLDLSPLDTKKVWGMDSMFYGCSGLTSLDLSPLDTQNVTYMYAMFYDCSGLTSLDLTPLDTKNVTDMHSIFYGCSGLTSLDLTPLDTQNVTDMYGMFYDCHSLASLDLTPLDTSKVTDMTYMFAGCSGLTSLTTGTTLKFVGTDYELSGTWQNTAGETFTSGKFPFNVADTYTKISS